MDGLLLKNPFKSKRKKIIEDVQDHIVSLTQCIIGNSDMIIKLTKTKNEKDISLLSHQLGTMEQMKKDLRRQLKLLGI